MKIEEFNSDLIDDVFLSSNEFYPSDAVLFLKNNMDWISKIGNIGNINVQHIEIPDISALCHGVSINEENSELIVILCDISKNKVKTEEIVKGKIEDFLGSARNFVERSFTEEIFHFIDDSEEEKLSVADQIRDNKAIIETIRFLFVTNRRFSENEPIKNGEGILMGKTYSTMVISLDDLFEFWKAESEEFIAPNIDFISLGYEIPIIKITQGGELYDGYMAAINGEALFEIYEEHDINLLQGNVRFFLNATRKQNKGIQETLKDNPEMFFAYNNGISATADNMIVFEQDGKQFIHTIDNLQIVNGGQTTASIHYFGKDDKNKEKLKKVFVPMKLSVLKEMEGSKEFVNNISRCANTQNTVKLSDLGSNNIFNEEMEKWSRKIAIPGSNGKKWYYERKTGDYFTTNLLLARNNDVVGLSKFRTEFDKNRLIKKTEIAIVLFSWGFLIEGKIDPRPYDAGKGAEKNYDKFQTFIKNNSVLVDDSFYKISLAKFILHEKIREIATAIGIPQQRNHVVNYTTALLSQKLNGTLDFNLIWEAQDISNKLKELVNEIIPLVWGNIQESSNKINLDTWCKKIDCWNSLKKIYIDTRLEIPEFLKESFTEASNNTVITYQLDDAINDSSFWYKMSAKAKELNCFTPRDRAFLYNLGVYIERKYKLTEKQIAYAEKCFRMIQDSGLSVE